MLLVIATMSSSPLLAADGQAVLGWKPPTQSTDGSTLAKCASQTSTPTDPCLRSFKVYHGTSASALNEVRALNDRNAAAYTWTDLAVGTHYFAVSAVNSDGGESALSDVRSKTIAAPTIFTVPPDTAGAASGTAYRMRQSVDGFEFVALGTVPVGTVCKDEAVGAYHIVPREAVRMASRFDTLPLVVYAKCSAG